MENMIPEGLIACRIAGVYRNPDRVRLEIGSNEFIVDLENAHTFKGDLPHGAEVEVFIREADGKKAEVRIRDEDRMDPELCELLRERYRLPVGLAKETTNGWKYIRIVEGENSDIVLSGRIEFRGFTGVFSPAERSWKFRKRLLDRVAGQGRDFPLNIANWIVEGQCWRHDEDGWALSACGERFPEIREDALQPPNFRKIAADTEHDFYWSDRFEPDFYRAQARAGLIAITMDRGDRVFLLPQLQDAYAVLDWENAHISRSMREFYRSEKYRSLEASLVVGHDLAPVLSAIHSHWHGRSWLSPEYVKLMSSLAAEPKSDFRIWGVQLLIGAEKTLAAGELGYTIGRTYTSLTGFSRRDGKTFDNLGKVQLHMLAALLEERGYAFWNLGHPYMQYKLDLGAKILARDEFLARWSHAVDENDPGLSAE